MAKQERTEVERALKLDPQSAVAHYKLAALAKKEGDTRTSTAEFATVRDMRDADLRRDLALGYVRSGVALTGKGDFAGAEAEFRKAVQTNPELGEGWFNLAGALLQQGKTDAAVEMFPSAIRLAPEWAEAHYQFAKALLKANRRQDAIKEFGEAVKQDPHHAEAIRALHALTSQK